MPGDGRLCIADLYDKGDVCWFILLEVERAAENAITWQGITVGAVYGAKAKKSRVFCAEAKIVAGLLAGLLAAVLGLVPLLAVSGLERPWVAMLVGPAGWRWVTNRRLWATAIIAPLVAAPWYIYIATHAGGTLSKQFLWYEIFSRIAGTPHGHGGPPGQVSTASVS